MLRRYLSCRVGRLDGLVAGLEKRSLSVGAFKSSIELSFVHARPLMMSLSLLGAHSSLLCFSFSMLYSRHCPYIYHLTVGCGCVYVNAIRKRIYKMYILRNGNKFK